MGLAFAAQPLFAGNASWLGAVALAGAVLSVRRSGAAWPVAAPVGARALWIGGLVVFVLALAVRLTRLDAVPPVWWDEGVEAYDAQCLAHGLPLEPLTGIHYHRSPLWSRVISQSGRQFGFSIGALRAPSAVAGALAVALAGAVAARLAGPLPAVVAAVWLVAHPWELHLSRVMLGNVSVPLAGAAIILVAGWGGGAPAIRAGLAGGIAGIAVWGYAAALALPPLALLAVWLLPASRRPVRRRLRDLLICGGVALVIAAPTAVLAPGMWEKTRQVSAVGTPDRLAKNLGRSLRMFHIEGDSDLRHNYPAGAPVFRGWLAPLFTLGVALALGSLRAPAARLALGWLFLGMLPGLASEGGAANQFRMAGVPPAAALLAGAGAAGLVAGIGLQPGGALAAALVLAGAAADLRDYLIRFPADPAAAVWFRTWTLDAGRHLAGLAAARRVTISPPLTLVAHPLEKAVLFDAIRTGRAGFGTFDGVSGARTEFRDPWGEPQAVMLAGSARIRYLTVLDVSAASDEMVKAGRPAAAIAHLGAALRLLPDSALLRERLGFARLAGGDLRGAEREFRAALALRPRLGASWDGLGGALFRQGRFAEAEAAVQEAIRQAPGEPEFRADLERVRSARAARMGS